MTLRLFLATICQETHSFSPIPTNRASFDMQVWRPVHDDELPPAGADLLGYGGFLERARAQGHRVRLGPFLAAQPGAPMSDETWRGLKAEVLDALAAAGDVDGVFLFLHGACAARSVPDCEGDLLETVRGLVGPRVPIAVELDLHANLTRTMVAAADILVACQDYPHLDFAARGAHACDLLVGAVRGEVTPVTAVRKLPFCGFYPTTAEPMAAFVAGLKAIEAAPGVLSTSALHGFVGSDDPETGGAVIVVADGDAVLANRVADGLAHDLARAVAASPQHRIEVGEALDQAAREPRGPVVLADRTDNPGGGAACDSTWILREIFARGLDRVLVGGLWDPVAAEIAHAAGEGAVIPLRIGGKIGPLSGAPLDLEVEVLAVRDDVAQAFYGRGEPTLPAGRSALVRAGGVEILVMSERQQVFDTRLFTGHGVDLASKSLIVVKSTQHFHESFAPIAARILYCDPPGTCTTDMASLPYRRLSRPLYPLDPETPVRVRKIE